MRHLSFQARLGLVLLALICFTRPGHCDAPSRSLTLDDVLGLEGIGTARMDPTGHWLVYEHIRPYDELPDYGFRTYAFARSGHEIWIKDLTQKTRPVRLPGLDSEAHTYIQGFSPTGQYLAFIQYKAGQVSLGIYDTESGQSHVSELAAAMDRLGQYEPVWISDTELVYSALPLGRQPALASVRQITGQTRTRLWQAAWRGDTPTGIELRSGGARRGEESAEAGSLIRLDARTGKTRTLAEGLHADVRVSPNRRWIAALRVNRPASRADLDPKRMDRHFYRLVLIDVETGQEHMVAPGQAFATGSIVWSPESERFAAYAWSDDQTAASGQFLVFYPDEAGRVEAFPHKGLDLVSERERGFAQRPERPLFLDQGLVVFARRASSPGAQKFTYTDIQNETEARADWYLIKQDGRSVNLTEGMENVSGIPVHSGPDHFTVWSEEGVFRIGPAGKPKRLTPSEISLSSLVQQDTFSTYRSVLRVPFRESALFLTGQGGLILVDLREGQEGQYRLLGDIEEGTLPLAWNFRTGTVALYTQWKTSYSLAVGDTRTGQVNNLLNLNTHLADVRLGSWRSLDYDVSDPEGQEADREVKSCLLLPPDFNPLAPPPVIIDVYPGTRPRCSSPGLGLRYPNPDSPYLWAARGYAYARIATPRDLLRTEDGPIAGMDEMIGAGVDAMAREGLVDPERAILYGISQGGVSALYVAAKTDRYRAVIAKHGWADLLSHYFGPPGVYADLYPEYMGGETVRYDAVAGSDFGMGRTVFEDPDIYVRNSPVFLAPDIETPILLVHTDMDSFPISQFDEMFGALQHEGKEVVYMRYFGEGHGLSSPANIRDLWRRTIIFLNETLAEE